jgi:hypothetical protein
LHWSEYAEQFRTQGAVHMPPAQASPVVQYSRSSQLVPSGTGSATQASTTSSHRPVAQAVVSAEQLRGDPAMHTPPVHRSVTVQYKPSLHVVPSGRGAA